ncbi:MAG: hypothetical protein IPP25_13610 [Saprospiraceae bacterium]|nr:hypothetical protein [Candidatus Opimibacter skivensis]
MYKRFDLYVQVWLLTSCIGMIARSQMTWLRINEGDPGTGQPKIQFNGCTCGCRWLQDRDNFRSEIL